LVLVSLDETKSTLLDILLNVGSVRKVDLPGFYSAQKGTIVPNIEKLNDSLDSLKRNKFIVEKDGILSVEPSKKDEAGAEVRAYLETANVTSQKVFELAERLDFRIPWLLASVHAAGGVKQVTFSDSFADVNVMSLCIDLASSRMAFQQAKDTSGRHTMTFYIRKFPFDVASTLKDLVRNSIKLDSVRAQEDLVMMAMVLYLSNSPTMDDLRVNLPDLTTEHLNEAVSRLAQKGVLLIVEEKLTVKEEMRPLLQSYFTLEYAPRLNRALFNSVKQKLNARMSNFYYFGLVERILSNKTIQTSSPFFAISRESLDVSEEDLRQAAKLGLLFMTKQEIILNTAVVEWIESIMRESLQRGALFTVHAGNVAEFNVAMEELFDHGSSHVRIQDPSLSEETLRLLSDYLKPEMEVMILSSVKMPSDSSAEGIEEAVRLLRGRVKSLDIKFVGDSGTGEAPFDRTLVITDGHCMHISRPLKDVGRSEDTYMAVEPVEVKDGLAIPSFDQLFESATKEWLQGRNLIRLSLNELLQRSR
jgi:hypothetical protein